MVVRRVAGHRPQSTIGGEAKRSHTHPTGEWQPVSRCERCCGLIALPIAGGRRHSIRRKGVHNRHPSCHCRHSEAHKKVQNEAQ
jgi:hypothetical protein